MVAWHPEYRPQRRASLIERVTLPLAARRAAAFQCISRSTAADLVAQLPRGQPDVRVVVPWPRTSASAPTGPRADLDGQTLRAGRRHARAAQEPAAADRGFCDLAGQRARRRVLALAGPIGWDSDETLAALRATPTLVRPLASCRTTSCPGSTVEPTCSPIRLSTRASGCPCSRRWPAARPSLRRTSPRCRSRGRRRHLRRPYVDTAAIRGGDDAGRSVTPTCERSGSPPPRPARREFSWSPLRALPSVLSEQISAGSAAT